MSRKLSEQNPTWKWIKIPFSPEMAEATRLGRKRCTTRNKRYGSVGDKFPLGGRTYVITGVFKHKLSYVAEKLYLDESFSTPSAFIEIWNRLHPTKGYDPDHEGYVHYYELEGESCSEAQCAIRRK